MDAILVSDTVLVPPEALAFRAVRAGGPGGQNVNKVASKVELRVDLDLVQGLDEPSRARLLGRIGNQLDAEGRWIVTSSLTRDQSRNLEDAREKIRQILLQALMAPVPRRATRPTRSSQARRVDGKKHLGRKKQLRNRIEGD